jgi:hypothetical protein
MFVDILKIVLPFLGGGLAGALLNEWFRRRSGKLQRIPLIERVNRQVSPELEGFTLARVTGDPNNQQLEEVENAREYQLTLRNTSTVHLRDVEIQFEFPTEDIEGWVSRPALSKTAPVSIEAGVTEPWKKGFRWRIPHLPSTDSIEFSFKAVNPPSSDYEVALYNADRVVVEKSKGEPAEEKRSRSLIHVLVPVVFGFVALAAASFPLLFSDRGGKESIIRDAECTFTISSSYQRFGSDEQTTWPWSSGAWQVSNRVVNAGPQKCVIQSEQLTVGPAMLSPGEDAKKTLYTLSKPKLIIGQLSFGTERPVRTASVELFGEPQQR